LQNKYAYWIFRNAISEEAMGKIKEIASQSEYKVATTDDGEDNKKARGLAISIYTRYFPDLFMMRMKVLVGNTI